MEETLRKLVGSLVRMPTIHLQVCAGFANRVRAMVSGICLAEDLNVQLVIHWSPISPECFGRFQSLLDPESLPKTCKVVPEALDYAIEVSSKEKLDLLFRRWEQKSDLHLKSYSIFYTSTTWDAHLRSIKPSRQVKEFLERRTMTLDWSRVIGVHIRRTDNQKSIEGSPLEKFLQKMNMNKEARYIVATDDIKVKERLMIEMGDRCIFPATVLSRQTEEGMIHGVADFFVLTKCSQIWGSYWSSFSEITARYGNVELTIVS